MRIPKIVFGKVSCRIFLPKNIYHEVCSFYVAKFHVLINGGDGLFVRDTSSLCIIRLSGSMGIFSLTAFFQSSTKGTLVKLEFIWIFLSTHTTDRILLVNSAPFCVVLFSLI